MKWSWNVPSQFDDCGFELAMENQNVKVNLEIMPRFSLRNHWTTEIELLYPVWWLLFIIYLLEPSPTSPRLYPRSPRWSPSSSSFSSSLPYAETTEKLKLNYFIHVMIIAEQIKGNECTIFTKSFMRFLLMPFDFSEFWLLTSHYLFILAFFHTTI